MADDDKHIINVERVHEMLRTPDDLSGDAADEAYGRAWDEIEAQMVKDLKKLDQGIMVDLWSFFNDAFREVGEVGKERKKKNRKEEAERRSGKKKRKEEAKKK